MNATVPGAERRASAARQDAPLGKVSERETASHAPPDEIGITSRKPSSLSQAEAHGLPFRVRRIGAVASPPRRTPAFWRWAWVVVVLAWPIFAHGCHGGDHDTELAVPPEPRPATHLSPSPR